MHNSTKVEVSIMGTSYPAFPSMGAMYFMKKDFGVEEITDNPLVITQYLYCAVKAACYNNKNINFDLSFEQFSCALTADDVQGYIVQLFPVGEDTQKKN